MTAEFVPGIPCLYDHQQWCENCLEYGRNFRNLQRLRRNRAVRYAFNKNGIDQPTIQHLADLISRHDEQFAHIYSDALEMTIFIPQQLKDFGQRLALYRHYWLVQTQDPNELITCPFFATVST